VVELVCLAEQALVALEAGDGDLAEERMKALVERARGAKEEGTGCGRRMER